jgi:adenine-specific DNA-methyltransferase
LSPRYEYVKVRRRALSAAGDILKRRRVRGLASFAREERLAQREAAIRLAQLAHFHRAAELYLRRSIRPNKLLRSVIAEGIVKEELCTWLADLGPRGDGPAWGAAAYSALLTIPERRDRGQFFTPEPIARVLAEWAIQAPTDRVLDPACGPGQLLASAHTRLRELGAQRPAEFLVGVELSILAPTFGAIALSHASVTPRVDLADFLTTFRARVQSYDAIIANPPYSRHQALSRAYKAQIGALADRLTRQPVHRSAGIHMHFLIRSLSLLKTGGRLAFLTPREFFDARYGGVVRAHLLKCARLRGLVVFDPAATAAFQGVLTTSAITLLERGVPDRKAVRIVHVRAIPTASELMAALEPEASLGARSWGWVEDVPYGEVDSANRWSSLVHRHPQEMENGQLVPLRDLVTVKRGIATGANHFFVLSKGDAETRGLDNGSLRPVIARANLAAMNRITRKTFARWSAHGERVWLLDIRHKKLTKAERLYVRLGEDQELDKRTLARMRTPWYRMERREPPPILATYMSKAGARFVRNDARLVPLNVFHGLYPKDINRRQLDELLKHLRGRTFQRKLRNAARAYGTGLVKIEPRELGALSVPDFRQYRQLAANRGPTRGATSDQTGAIEQSQRKHISSMDG